MKQNIQRGVSYKERIPIFIDKEQKEDGTYDISGIMKEAQLKEAVKSLIKKTLES